MSSFLSLAILFLFLLFMLLGMPIVFAAGIPSLLYLIFNNIPLSMIVQRMGFSLNKFNLLAIPMFILAGNLMNECGITKRIFSFASDLVGSLPAGLAHANIVSSLIFAGMSGSALADVGGLGQVEIKAMEEDGYDTPFSIAVTLASATIGPIFPPSGMFIIYALIAELSVLALYLGGIVPGILIAIALMIHVAFVAKRRNFPKKKRVTLKQLIFSFFNALPSIFAPVIIIGGMATGIFSVTEAAISTVIYSVFLGVFLYKELNLKKIYDCCLQTIYFSSSLAVLISTSLFLGWVITVSRIPQNLTVAIMSLGVNASILKLLIIIFLLFLGCFIENSTIILLVVPVLIPGLRALGIDLVHFGVVMMLVICIGLVTPPMGLSIFLMSNITGVKIERIVREILPFLIPLIGISLILAYIPGLVLYIPKFFNLIE